MTRDRILGILQERYGHTWRLCRTESLWLAIARDPDAAHARTVVHDDLDAFLAELESPPPRTGPHASLLAATYFAARAESRGDGAYRYEDPPPA